MTPDNVGVLVHLGLDTVQLSGRASPRMSRGDTVEPGSR